MRDSNGPSRESERPHVVSRTLTQARHRIFVQLPTWLPRWLVPALSVAGISAFTIAGFTGYPDSPAILRVAFFYHPILLFLWTAALLFALERSIFEHPSDDGQVVVTRNHRQICYSVTAVCVIISAAAFLRPDIIDRLLTGLASTFHTNQGKFTFSVVNFYLIGIFWFDVVKRYKRRRAGSVSGEKETLYSNFFAAGLLTGVLAILLRADVINVLVHSLQIGGLEAHSFGNGPVSDCTVSWMTSQCAHVASPRDLPTLTFLDTVQTLLYLALGVILLGIAALQPIFPNHSPGSPMPIIEKPGLLSVTEPGIIMTTAVTEEVPSAIIRAGFALIRSLRNVVWPALILLASGAVVAVAHFTQRYLHVLSCEHQLAIYGHAPYCVQYRPMLVDSAWLNYQYILSALAWTLLAGVFVILAVVFLLFDWESPIADIGAQVTLARQVALHWAQTLGTIGSAIIVPFLLFSLGLWLFNYLLEIVAGRRAVPLPFHPPGIVTYALFVLSLGIVAYRRKYDRSSVARSTAAL